MDEDLYRVLGVARTASDDEIRKAYRKLAREHHPDLNGGDVAAEGRFKKLSAAYEVLSKPEKRSLYDEFGADAAKIGYDPDRANAYRASHRREAASGFDPFGSGHGGEHADFEDLLGDLFARGSRAQGPVRGRDMQSTLRITFRDAVLGATPTIELPPRAEEPRRSIALRIPAGVEDGQRLRLAGHGAPGPRGGPPGDLLVAIEIEPHPVFTRDGNQLQLEVPITIGEALLGARIEVPTLSGTLRVTVPPKTASGAKLRLRGKGIDPASGTAGDLVLTLHVVMPEGGDEPTRARIAEELASLYEKDVRASLGEEAKR